MAENKTPTKAKPGSETLSGKTPSPADAMFFYWIVKNMKSKADVDWAGVAADHGFKNAEVAKVRFGQVKRKLGIGEATPTKSTPAKDKATPSTESKVKKTPTGRAGTKGKKTPKKEETKDEDTSNVKMEDVEQAKVKKEAEVKDEEDHADAPNAQLSREEEDMSKFVNMSPDPEPFF